MFSPYLNRSLVENRADNYANQKELCDPHLSVQLLASSCLHLTYSQILLGLIQYGFKLHKGRKNGLVRLSTLASGYYVMCNNIVVQ